MEGDPGADLRKRWETMVEEKTESLVARSKAADPKRKKTVIIAITVVLILVIVIIGSLLNRGREQPNQVSSSDLKSLSTDGIQNKVTMNGKIESARNTTLYSSQALPVDEVKVAVGDRVVAEQIVAELDGSSILSQIREIETENRQSNTVTSTTNAEQQTQPGQQSPTKSTQRLWNDYAATTIRAPFAGIISDVQVSQGKPATGPLLTVADDAELLVKAEVKEANLENLKTGAKVTFTTPSTGAKEFTGEILKIAPVAVPESTQTEGKTASSSNKVSFPVEIKVAGQHPDLRLGSSVRAQVVDQIAAGSIAVPFEAVYDTDNGDNAILVITTDNKVAERKVTPGESTSFDVVVKNNELSSEDRVITQPEKYRDLIDQTVTLTDSSVAKG